MATVNSGVQITSPAACVAAAGLNAGLLGAGTYSYAISFITAFGESAIGIASNVVTAGALSSMSLTGIPVWGDTNVTARKIYRTVAGGATYKLVATIPDNVTTVYSDGAIDSSLGVTGPSFSTADSLQLVKGYMSFSRPIQGSVAGALTALAGGGQTGATLASAQINIIAVCATLNDSVVLPTLSASLIGLGIEIKNNGVASCNIFPALGQTINALAVNTAIAQAAAAVARYRAVSATNWQAM